MPEKQTIKIADNRERWDLVVKISNIGFYDWYPLEDKITWDLNLHRITGLNQKSKLQRQEYFNSIIHSEDVEKVVKDMADTLDPKKSQDRFDNHFRAIVKDQLRYFRTAGVREKNKDGLVNKVFGIVMDTTSQVETEKRIRENEERLRIAAEASGFGTFDFLVPENKLFWDKQMHDIFGLKEDSKVDRNNFFFEHIHTDDKERVLANYARRMGPDGDDDTAFDEFRIIIDSEIKYITSHGTIVRAPNGSVLRVTGTLFDITNLKRTEKELAKSQEYFRSVIEGNSDHIFTVNKKKEIVFINHVAPGLTKEEVIGTPLLDLVVPKDRKMVNKVLDQVIKSGEYGQYETTFESPDGTIYYSTIVSPLLAGGKAFGATFISRDITKLKESQKKLRKQANELQITNQNLEQFAYVSSHDIKAPVTNLDSLLKIIEEEDVIKDEGKDLFERLKSTVGQMNQTISNLNEVFSVQSNLNLPAEELDLQSNLDEVLGTIENQIKESGAKISSNFKKAPTLPFPQVHLRSILQNLITNSIKYRKNDIPPIIKITSKINTQDLLQLEISDNGRGFDLALYGDKIFGLFQRFHLDTDGKGMGLYLIKLIVESYGGQISVQSKLNEGSTFTILF